MVVKNKLAWSSIEAVNRDFGSCLYDLQSPCTALNNPYIAR